MPMRLPPDCASASAASSAGWRSKAYMRSRTTGRIMCFGSRLSARGGSRFPNLPQNFRSRITRHHRRQHHAPARRFDLFPSDNLVRRPIAALYENVGQQPRDHFPRRFFLKNNHRVDAFQRRQNFRALALRQNRPARSFQRTHARIAIYADDQNVSQSARLLKTLDVPGMQQVETSVGEYHALSVAFLAAKLQNRFV